MARKVLIQIRRGLEKDIGTLAVGELGYCEDTEKLYIGTAKGNVLLVAAQTVGDMLKSIYDTNNDGKVDMAEVADKVPWNGITGKPTTFPPSNHKHDDKLDKNSPVAIGTLKMDGGSIAIVRPNTTGGWARGISIKDKDGVTDLLNIGVLGSADNISYAYIAISGYQSPLIKILPNGQIEFIGKVKFKTPLTWNDLKGV